MLLLHTSGQHMVRRRATTQTILASHAHITINKYTEEKKFSNYL